MFRLFFGFFLIGLTASAHAADVESARVSLSTPDQSIIRFVNSDTDYFPRFGDNGVAFNRTANVATSDVAFGGSAFGNTSPFSISKPQKEAPPATSTRWGEGYGGNPILSLARHKRVEFMADRFKVTLRQDSALIETGHLKVALRSGSTSMLWSKAL